MIRSVGFSVWKSEKSKKSRKFKMSSLEVREVPEVQDVHSRSPRTGLPKLVSDFPNWTSRTDFLDFPNWTSRTGHLGLHSKLDFPDFSHWSSQTSNDFSDSQTNSYCSDFPNSLVLPELRLQKLVSHQITKFNFVKQN